MTDEQWLLAIAEYNSDQTRWDRDAFVGGAYQLSQRLLVRTKEEPARFANLLTRFPATTHVDYFEAVLHGLGEVNDDVDIALKVCRYCHSLPDRPCGRSIHAPITKVSKQPLAEEVFEIIAWYSTEATDPYTDSDTNRSQQREPDLDFIGVNSIRGSAVRAIAHLLFDDPSRSTFFVPTLEKALEDPALPVRACVAEALTALLNTNRDLAVDLFLRLVKTDDRIFSSTPVNRFINYAHYTHFEQIKSVIERMLDSQDLRVAELGAQHACFIALRLEEALPLAQACISGSLPQRKGVAAVLARHIPTSSNRFFCEQSLIKLFQDPDPEIQKVVAGCFRQFEDDTLGDFTELVDAFAMSPSFEKNAFHLIYALETTTARLPDITCTVCERFVYVAGSKIGDPRTRMPVDASLVSKLVIRTYEQNKDKTIQSRCLNMIDTMAQLTTHGLLEALSLLDR